MRFSLPYTAATDRGRPHNISLKLRDMNQLFNSMDPSPFIEKDLDDDAEEFIVSWAQEFPFNAPLKLRIYLDQWPAEDPKELIRMAVHNHFAHGAQITDLEFKRLLRQGRTSLLIGLLFLALVYCSAGCCWVVRRALGLRSCERALRLPDGSPCGGRCKSIFTIGGPSCDGAGFMPS